MVLKFKKKHSSLFIQHLLRICSTEACFSIVMYDNIASWSYTLVHLHILFSILSLSSHIANLPTSLIDLFLLCISPLLFPSPQSKPYSRSSSPCAYREERGFDLARLCLKNTEPNSAFIRGWGSFTQHISLDVYYVHIRITQSLLLHFSRRDRQISDPLVQRLAKATGGYAPVNGSAWEGH